MTYADPAFGGSEEINFIKLETHYSYYLPLYKRTWIWANSLRGGYVSNLIKNLEGSGVPANYAFFLGSQSTIRGFGGSSDKERIPSGNELEKDDKGNELIIKEYSYFYLVKSEWRFYFPVLNPLGFVFFYDGGRVYVKGTSPVTGVKFTNPYRHSVGVGLRLKTPFGPVVLDYARKIHPREDEQVGRIHFSIGGF